jgi:hypothetical protein
MKEEINWKQVEMDSITLGMQRHELKEMIDQGYLKIVGKKQDQYLYAAVESENVYHDWSR